LQDFFKNLLQDVWPKMIHFKRFQISIWQNFFLFISFVTQKDITIFNVRKKKIHSCGEDTLKKLESLQTGEWGFVQELSSVCKLLLRWWLTLTIWSAWRRIPYEKVGDACRKIWIKPLKEINLGVARALFDLQEIPLKTEKAHLQTAVWERSLC